MASSTVNTPALSATRPGLPVITAAFPGPWVGAITLILGPLVLLAGMLLRLPYDFFFPAQLAAAASDPQRIAMAYTGVAAGTLLLWPAMLALVQQIGARRPGIARWAGIFVISGLFARIFHAGADHLAIQLTSVLGAPATTTAVASTYGAFHIVKIISPMIMAGWVILAVGAYRAQVLGSVRSVALALMSGVPLGVLKGTTAFSLLGVAGLCLACVPLGVQMLRARSWPVLPVVLGWAVGIVALGLAFLLLGQAG
jgi:hypothetical protein